MGAVGTEDVAASATIVGRNRVGFAYGTPSKTCFDIVLDVHGIAKVKPVIRSQFRPHLLELLYELPLGFEVGWIGTRRFFL